MSDSQEAQVPDVLAMYAGLNPDKPVVIHEDRVMTWSELNEKSKTLARALYGLGLRPGDKASLMTYNLPEYFEVREALTRLGVGMVPVGYRMVGPEIEYIVDNSDSKMLFFFHEFADRIIPRRDNYEKLLPDGLVSIAGPAEGAVDMEKLYGSPADVDLDTLDSSQGDSMIYTSGTTGKPKGAMRRGNVMANESVRTLLTDLISFLKYGPDEVHLVACPLYHSAPIVFSMIAYYLGGTMVLMPKYDPLEFLKNIERHKVTSVNTVPTILNTLLELPEETVKELDLSSLRTMIVGAAPTFPQTKLAILDRFGPVLYEYYGSTELGVNTFINPEEMRERPGSVGRGFSINDIKLLDDDGKEVPQGEPGEFYTHHGMLIDGYYKDDEATQESLHGKYMTVGDMAMQDEDGYYFIVDRKNDMIIRAGVNIYPAEVETVLSRMSGVADIAVVGIPDEHWGEIVAAFVVLEKGSKITEEDIKEFGRGEMTHYLIPEIIEFLDELPRTPTGKVLKRNLRAEMKLKRV